MYQENLWATAPRPVTLTYCTQYYEEHDDYAVVMYLHYSKAVNGEKVHSISVKLEKDELEAASVLYWTADRYFWKNRPVRHVEREVKKRLAKYRAEVNVTRIPTSGFHAVDFG